MPSRKQAMLDKCKQCMCGYADGREDCRIHSCPLYPWMPYGQGKIEASPAVKARMARARLSRSNSSIGQGDSGQEIDPTSTVQS